MASVDADDDGILRYVVWRYAYDSRRHERRHQIFAAFDNGREFERLIVVDLQERYGGLVLEPGCRRHQQDSRLLMQAMRHGVTITDGLLAQLDLPPNGGIIRATS